MVVFSPVSCVLIQNLKDSLEFWATLWPWQPVICEVQHENLAYSVAISACDVYRREHDHRFVNDSTVARLHRSILETFQGKDTQLKLFTVMPHILKVSCLNKANLTSAEKWLQGRI